MATTEKRVIGQDVTRVDGIDRVTGQARYAADLSLPGTLYCRLLRSPHAHARIRGIDTSRAGLIGHRSRAGPPVVTSRRTSSISGSSSSLRTEHSSMGTRSPPSRR